MLTDQEIQDLIKSPKEIKEKIPVNGYKEESGYKRCNLALESAGDSARLFLLFIRQNNTFIENFSIGLHYQSNDREFGSLTLLRYNGPHGERSRCQDGHYDKPHIHRIRAAEMDSGHTQPQKKHRAITDKYDTFEEALNVFFADVGVKNYLQYFPECRQKTLF